MKYLYFVLLMILFGCGQDTKEDIDEGSNSSYANGKYCADVTYYNPNTGTRNTYTLNVEVEDNELIKIYWGNGGWLDDSHFSPQELDQSGYCSFTSDQGNNYEVKITGSECNNTDEPQSASTKSESTCPKCGLEKETYDEYCYSCQQKIEREQKEKEDIEAHTCPKCGQYDAFMFSTDDECSDCERKRKAEEEEEEERSRKHDDSR